MFPFRRKRQLGNAAAGVLPPINENTTVNHNYPSRAAVVFVLMVGILLAPVLLWNGLVYLVSQLGFRQPEQIAAWGIISFIVFLGLASILGVFAKWLANDYYDYRERMRQLDLDEIAKMTRLAQLAPPQAAANMSYAEHRKYMAVKLTMDKAYHQGFIDENGKLRTKSQPWSTRQVGELTLPGERSKIGKDSDLASWVAGYLLEKRILLNDREVNIKTFSDLASVEAQLVKDFGRPISYSGQGEKFGMSANYVDRGTGSGSWSG